MRKFSCFYSAKLQLSKKFVANILFSKLISKFIYKIIPLFEKKVSALFSSHSSHGFLGGVLATVLLLGLVEAIGEAELDASGVYPLLLLEPHVAVGTVGLLALGVEDVVHVQA